MDTVSALQSGSQVDRRIVGLEMVRGLAALYVLLLHLCINFYGDLPQAQTMAFSLFIRFGREAVMLFFVLSGLVIHLSTSARSKPDEFLVRRLVRLYPMYILAIALGCWAAQVSHQPWSMATVLQHLLFVQTINGYIAAHWHVNGSLRSLSYEMFFYLTFAAILLAGNRKILVGLWMYLSLVVFVLPTWPAEPLVAHIASMLLFSIPWIVGYALPSIVTYIRIDAWTAGASVGICLLTSQIGWLVLPKCNVEISPEMGDRIGIVSGVCIAPLFLWILQRDPRLLKGRKLNPHRFDLFTAAFAAVAIWIWGSIAHQIPSSKIQLFLILCVLAMLVVGRFARHQSVGFLTIAASVVLLVLKTGRFMDGSHFSGLILGSLPVLFGCLLPCLAALKTSAIVETAALRLGKLSYGIYATHMPIMYLLAGRTGSPVLDSISIIVATISLVWVFEETMQRWITDFFRPARQPIPC